MTKQQEQTDDLTNDASDDLADEQFADMCDVCVVYFMPDQLLKCEGCDQYHCVEHEAHHHCPRNNENKETN